MLALLAAAALLVDGGPKPSTLGAADLAAMPRATAESTIHGKPVRCEGVLLRDVIARDGAPAGRAVRGEALSTIVLASARDGYRVVSSLGELLGASPAIVADRCDGAAPGPDDGPLRLLVPGDKRGARSVRMLERLTIATVPAPAAPTGTPAAPR